MPKIEYYKLYNSQYSPNEYIVKGWFCVPDGVLKGQMIKKYIESINASSPEQALAIAQTKYGEDVDFSNDWLDPQVSLNHLPDDGDY